MIKKPDIAVLYHIFYEDSCELVCQELQALHIYDPFFLFNICAETPEKITISKTLKAFFPNCFIITTSNIGKDIGAKFALFKLFLQLEIQADFLLFLHDKKSLQALKSSTWKNDLLRIVSAEGIQNTIEIFEKNEACGIVGAKEYVIKEPFENNELIASNGKILHRLLKEYNINLASYEFVAGTMFWARALPLKSFFSQYDPLEIRKTLEDGNVIDNFSGTITHSWERLLNWIITGNGYNIKGI